MKNARKTLALMISVLAMAAVFAGCSESSSASDASSSNADSSSSSSAADSSGSSSSSEITGDSSSEQTTTSQAETTTSKPDETSSKPDETTKQPEQTTTTTRQTIGYDKYPKEILGTWRGRGNNYIVTFSNGNELTMRVSGFTTKGSYELKGSILKFNYSLFKDQPIELEFDILSFTENTLELRDIKNDKKNIYERQTGLAVGEPSEKDKESLKKLIGMWGDGTGDTISFFEGGIVESQVNSLPYIGSFYIYNDMLEIHTQPIFSLASTETLWIVTLTDTVLEIKTSDGKLIRMNRTTAEQASQQAAARKAAAATTTKTS